MHEIGLIYRGKKKPFQYDNPKTGKLRFTPGVVEWIPAKSAEFLVSVNPAMFIRAGERGAEVDEIIFEDAGDIIRNKALQDAEENYDEPEPIDRVTLEPKEESPAPVFMTCEKCGRKYAEKQKKWYDLHIAKCEG